MYAASLERYSLIIGASQRNCGFRREVNRDAGQHAIYAARQKAKFKGALISGGLHNNIELFRRATALIQRQRFRGGAKGFGHRSLIRVVIKIENTAGAEGNRGARGIKPDALRQSANNEDAGARPVLQIWPNATPTVSDVIRDAGGCYGGQASG